MVFRTFLALFALAVGLAGPAAAQVATTGTLVVTAQDPDGGRLPGVVVTAKAADTVTTRSVVTNAEGVATLEALAPSAQYEISVQLAGFQDQIRPNILVRSGQTTAVPVTLSLGSVTEAVTVTAASPIVDTRSATSGQDITLQLTESLPTGRSYQSYLQMVPGVMPDDPTSSGNPAARGGINYSDIAGNMGVSSDNAYYFDGINVTDPSHRHLRGQSQYRDHPGTEGHHRRHSGRVRGHARAHLERHHQIGFEPLHRVGQLFLSKPGPDGRERKRAVGRVRHSRQRVHVRGPDRPGSGVVLWQLSLQQPRGRRLDPRYAAVPSHGRQHSAPGLCQGHLGTDRQRPD